MPADISTLSLQEVMEAVPAEDVVRWRLNAPPRPPSDLLQEMLRQRAETFDLTHSDAAKQIQIDALLTDVVSQYHPPLKIWKSERIEGDEWTGVADYLFAPKRAWCAAPFVCVGTVARHDDFEQGFVECLATMTLCRTHNEKIGHSIDVFGFVSNGQEWHFYRLEPSGTIWESGAYSMQSLSVILGALHHICAECAKNAAYKTPHEPEEPLTMNEETTDYLELLVRVVKPPSQPVYNDGPVSWGEIERAIGFALPDDYKGLIHTYGSGLFGDYLGFYNPFRCGSVEAYVAQLSLLSNIVNDNKEKAPEYYPPFDFCPKGPVVILGYTDDTGNVSWFREGGSDGGGSIVCTDADFSPNFGYYRRTLTRFLYEWITGQIIAYSFSDIPLAERATFTPATK